MNSGDLKFLKMLKKVIGMTKKWDRTTLFWYYLLSFSHFKYADEIYKHILSKCLVFLWPHFNEFKRFEVAENVEKNHTIDKKWDRTT